MLRPIHGYAGLAISFREAGRRFVLSLIRPDNGEPRLRVHTREFSPTGFRDVPITLPPGQALIMAELRFDAASRRAAAYLDGKPVLDDYEGDAAYLDQPGFSLATGRLLSAIGESIIGDARFDMA
jgi:hypothetical protein